MDGKKIGAHLAALRKSRGMTQQDTADVLHISNRTVSKWESGAGLPDIVVLPVLAELYGITVDEILAGEPLERGTPPIWQPELRERQRYLAEKTELRWRICLGSAEILLLAGILLRRYGAHVSLILFLPALLVLWIGWQLGKPALRDAPAAGYLRRWRLLTPAVMLALWCGLWIICSATDFYYRLMDLMPAYYALASQEYEGITTTAAMLLVPAVYGILQGTARRAAGARFWLIGRPYALILMCACISWSGVEVGRYCTAAPYIRKLAGPLSDGALRRVQSGLNAAMAPFEQAHLWILTGAAALTVLCWILSRLRRRKK